MHSLNQVYFKKKIIILLSAPNAIILRKYLIYVKLLLPKENQIYKIIENKVYTITGNSP